MFETRTLTPLRTLFGPRRQPLRATDPKVVVVLTALELEYAAVTEHLTGVKVVTHRAGTQFEVGYLPDCRRPIAVAAHGEGITTAAVMSERAITMFDPVAVLFVGVAGALHNDLKLGDLVVATRVYLAQSGKEGPAGFRVRPRAWDAPHRLEQQARQVARAGAWTRRVARAVPGVPMVRFRPIIAGDVVLSSRTGPQREFIDRSYDDAAAVEMEGAGVARAAHLNESPTLIIRGISDLADSAKEDMDSQGWQERAAANAAAFALELIERMPIDAQPVGKAS